MTCSEPSVDHTSSRLPFSSLPAPQGLYDPRFEHDACGVSFVVDIKGRKSHDIVETALGALCNLDHRGELIEVGEGGLRFLVNLWDYLDTGLFLDHRPLRARVREMARDKRFLNLFCYTGSVSVYAADGGAAETTSVDLSQTYLEWATRNLALNGFANNRHKLVRDDAAKYLEHHSAMYDLIFVDPPTFSNSKSAADFDVQRDHARLLQLCGERLLPGGVIFFSNNFRRFKLDETALAGFAIRDISASTIPFDFERNARIHKAWEFSKK